MKLREGVTKTTLIGHVPYQGGYRPLICNFFFFFQTKCKKYSACPEKPFFIKTIWHKCTPTVKGLLVVFPVSLSYCQLTSWSSKGIWSLYTCCNGLLNVYVHLLSVICWTLEMFPCLLELLPIDFLNLIRCQWPVNYNWVPDVNCLLTDNVFLLSPVCWNSKLKLEPWLSWVSINWLLEVQKVYVFCIPVVMVCWK